MNQALDNLETRQRVLTVATEVFAEQGYRAATARRICERADVNLAAINYHFGSKFELYIEVLREAFRRAYQKYPNPIRANDSAEDYLRKFVGAYLFRLLDQDTLSGVGRLMLREMADATPALDIMMKEVFFPHFQALSAIVKELLHNADDETVHQCVTSIIGQCIFYRFSFPIITRCHPEKVFDKKEIQEVVEHVVRFSLAALKTFIKT